MNGDEDLDLNEAYAVETPDDNRDLYGRWATTYESGFATRHAYVYHERVAATFTESVGPDDDPVLDIGCGTGLVGEALRALGDWTIDGLDLSPEMLDEARGKTARDGSPVYRDLHVADLTAPLEPRRARCLRRAVPHCPNRGAVRRRNQPGPLRGPGLRRPLR